MAIKTFTAGSVLTASDTNTFLANAGLVYIAETTFSGAANPFINGCFSSTYQNYRILISISPSTTTNLRFRLRYGTSTTENGLVYDRFGFSVVSGVLTNETTTNETSWWLGDMYNTTQTPLVAHFDLFNPNIANVHTNSLSMTWSSNSGRMLIAPIRVETNTQYTGCELYGDSGTLTGSMRVYGYRQA